MLKKLLTFHCAGWFTLKKKERKIMENEWDTILEQYICNVISPDGRDTFESTQKLIDEIMNVANISADNVVLDMGCGWGNVTRVCATKTSHTVIGIEPNFQNIEEAKQRSKEYNINYIQGSFEKPGFDKKADIIKSMIKDEKEKEKNKSKSKENIEREV